MTFPPLGVRAAPAPAAPPAARPPEAHASLFADGSCTFVAATAGGRTVLSIASALWYTPDPKTTELRPIGGVPGVFHAMHARRERCLLGYGSARAEETTFAELDLAHDSLVARASTRGAKGVYVNDLGVLATARKGDGHRFVLFDRGGVDVVGKIEGGPAVDFKLVLRECIVVAQDLATGDLPVFDCDDGRLTVLGSVPRQALGADRSVALDVVEVDGGAVVALASGAAFAIDLPPIT